MRKLELNYQSNYYSDLKGLVTRYPTAISAINPAIAIGSTMLLCSNNIIIKIYCCIKNVLGGDDKVLGKCINSVSGESTETCVGSWALYSLKPEVFNTIYWKLSVRFLTRLLKVGNQTAGG